MNDSLWLPLFCSRKEPGFLGSVLNNSAHLPTNFNQPFAYVISNPHTQEIIAVRDPWGFEPLYFYYQRPQFIFGSNIPDVLKQLPKVPALNSNQIIDHFTKGLVGELTYTDETCYQGIYRVEPGHILRIRDGKIFKKPYWQLDRNAAPLLLKTDRDYLEQFTELMSQAIQDYTSDTDLVAAEFSGGLDSSAVVLAAHHNKIAPALFMHITPPNGNEVDDSEYAKAVVQHLQLKNIHAVDAQSFDPLRVFQQCAQLFAGAPPHLFYMLANNIHQAVSDHHYKILLSGFGGDECVSGHAPLRMCVTEFIKKRHFQKAWQELLAQYPIQNKAPPNAIRRFLHLLKSSHPALYYILCWMGNLDERITAYLKFKRPLYRSQQPFYSSIREFEYDLLQGSRSHHLRMRIEYSAIVAKSLGFEYRYPLLHPELVDFCFRLPIEQKRRHGINRYLIRQYLAQSLPSKIYHKHQKRGSIAPATLEKCKEFYKAGLLEFSDVPFQKYINKNLDDFHQMIGKIYAFMFKESLQRFKN